MGLLPVVGLLAVLGHFSFRRIKQPKKTETTETLTRAPEPDGALPLIGHLHLLGGEAPVARILGAMVDKHGPIFSLRLGSHQALVVSSWEFVKECFTTNDTIFASRPSMAVSKYFYDHAVFALAPYGPYWRDVRKIVTLELLTNSRLEKLSHVRESEVDSSIRDLHLLCMKNVDNPTTVVMNKWFEHLTFNIILRMLAGKRFSGSSESGPNNPEENEIKEAIKKGLYLSGIFVVSDAIPWLEWVDIGGYVKAMKKTAKEIDVVLGNWLQEHIDKRKLLAEEGESCDRGSGGGNSQSDFIDVMLSVLEEDTEMSGYKRDTVIKATILILILTGSESTAETLTWALSLLLNNRRVLKAAQQELDIQIGRHKWVQESDITKLPYLQAIVKETLRLYPPGPLAGPREATQDCHVGGYFVPKGTRLIVNLWKLQRDPRIWTHPDEFRPERFITDHANVGYRGQQHEYIPFSSGRRMCPGVTFGLQVVQLTLARLLHGFNIATPMEVPVDMTEGLGIALPKVNPLEAVLTPRLPFEAYYENV
ncbi:xanthotoxin 5-hydroxylase CYP82C4-like isoform X2 [Camellia sinensis]|uniref:xanthotoxin 5-hydroxylase CYP82C4-like isoform X1 n=1 Tax=Camellia sinensis TaxID=4442 RepID=UPI0010362EB2|nr:xanthotoxin 5-hydroxylase CYP82C4-like isoform X1 [Camellia sinensis]XP_028058718.1 xanthotoxin 5-hydroxylase CYP82C4-like isoform X2 [Camellia sinensis]